MDFITLNPYRVLDVYSNASTKQITSNESRIKAFIKVGKTMPASTDMKDLLDDIKRDNDTLAEARAALNTPQDRMWHALFWWACVTEADKQALVALNQGDTEAAMTTWAAENGTFARLNLAVLDMAMGCNTDGAAQIVKLLRDPQCVADIAAVVASGEFINAEELLARFIEELATNGAIAPARTLSKAGLATQEIDPFLMNVAKKPLEHISAEVDKAVAAIESEPPADKYLETGRHLVEATRTTLARLRALLGSQNMQYQFIADKLADKVLSCGIGCYNRCGLGTHLEMEAFELMEYALQVAQGSVVKQRCQENIDVIKRNMPLLPPDALKDEHDALMNLVAAAREANYIPSENNPEGTLNEILQKSALYLARIRTKPGHNNEYYVGVSTLLAEAALSRMISLVNETVEMVNQSYSRDYAAAKAKTRLLSAMKTVSYIGLMSTTPDFQNRRFFPKKVTLMKLYRDLNGFDYLAGAVTVNEFDLRTDKEIFATCSTKQDFMYLLERFPDTQYAAAASAEIQRFEAEEQKEREADEQAWAACATLADRKRYYKERPTGLHAQEAKDELEANRRKKSVIAIWAVGGAIILALIIAGLTQLPDWSKFASKLLIGLLPTFAMFVAFIMVKKCGKHVAAAGGLFVLLILGAIMVNNHKNKIEAEQKEAEYEQLMANFSIDKAVDYLKYHYGEDHYYDVQGRLSEALEEKVPEIGDDTLKINEFLGIYGNYAYDSTISALEERRDSIRWADEAKAWEMAELNNTTEDYDRYLKYHPNGAHANIAYSNKIQTKIDQLPNCNSLPEFDHYGSGGQCSIVIENDTEATLTVLMSGPVGKEVEIAPHETKEFTVPKGEYDIAYISSSSTAKASRGHETLTGGYYVLSLCLQTSYSYTPTYHYSY